VPRKPAPGDPDYRGIRNLGFYLRVAVPTAALFALVYFATNWITSRRTDNFHLYLDLELAIPFVPGMIIVYASILILVLLPAFLLSRRRIRVLARAILVTLLVAALIFLLLPADLGFERPACVPGYDAVYQALYALEMPHNLVPSLHIACTTLLVAALLNSTGSPWLRLGLLLWGILLGASVLLVHQHHMLDIVSGLLLGLGTYRLYYLPRCRRESGPAT
jgi:membrane-associated phospholipid phosphatase